MEDEPLRMTAELESAARISSGLRAIRLAALRHCIRGCAMVDHKALLYSSPAGNTDSAVELARKPEHRANVFPLRLSRPKFTSASPLHTVRHLQREI